MRLISSNSSFLPYFNLASEQFLLEGTDDIFMLWRNGKSVIIGKNQNAFSEINIPFCEKNNIKIARRLTGGGAVFHDPGNINFSFITDAGEDGIDFKKFLVPIIDSLKTFGISPEADGRNDIIVNGMKISGNAQCVYDTKDGRKRLLHHGTLLFSADMSDIAGSLNVSKEKLQAKGIKSVSSRVTNIADLDGYSGPESPEKFMDELIHIAEKNYSCTSSDFTNQEINQIEEISKEKFSNWEWIFGKSPEYATSVKKRFDYGTIEVSYSTNHGIIDNISITGDFFGEKDIKELEKALSGVRLQRESILSCSQDLNKYIKGANPFDLADLILG